MQPVSDDPSRLFQEGARLLRLGRLTEAEPYFRRLVALQPQLPAGQATLGTILAALGRLEEAEPHLRTALRLQPNSADAAGNLGNLLRDLGRLEEAESCLRQALRLRAHYPQAMNNLGAVLRDLRREAEAETCFRQALALAPEFHIARMNLARTLQQRNRLAEAEGHYRTILQASPQNAEAQLGLGEVLRRQGAYPAAETCLRQALRLRPGLVEGWIELGNVLLAAAQPAAALACFRSALGLSPDRPESHLGLGIAHASAGRYEEAEHHFRKALSLRSDFAAAHSSLGDTLRNRGRFAEAEASIRRALELEPGLAEATVNLAFTLLQTGRAREGWQAYEHRWKAMPWSAAPRIFPGRRWAGEDLAGQTILLHSEQGLGDTLQFVRYAMLFPAGVDVVLQVQPPLVGLLRQLPRIRAVHAFGDALPPVPWHCSLLSLPHRFADAAVPATPYLGADPAGVAQWRERLKHLRGAKVGLAWAGGPALTADARRSLPLRALEPLADLAGISFVSLQRGPAAMQAAHLPLERPAMDGDGFEDTAALIMALDLVISVDTAVLHLASALGKPVWLLNRHDPCWRWPPASEPSPWYPGLRQFRQTAPGDWPGVVQQLRHALQRREWSQAPAAPQGGPAAGYTLV
jgi:tetratricopeptide (TPR) repeat protein